MNQKKNLFVKDIKDIKKDQFILILDELNIIHHKRNDLYMCKYRALYKPYLHQRICSAHNLLLLYIDI